jgi:hypothetical protein
MQPRPCHRLTRAIENVAGAERQGGTGDHRGLLGSTYTAASNMPAAALQPVPALSGLDTNDQWRRIEQLHRP